MMDFARFSRFQDQADVGADGFVDEVVMEAAEAKRAGMAAIRELMPRSDKTRMLAHFNRLQASMHRDSMAVSIPSAPLLTG